MRRRDCWTEQTKEDESSDSLNTWSWRFDGGELGVDFITDDGEHPSEITVKRESGR